MRVRRLKINNFRGVSQGSVDFSGHTLLVGGNNIGKSTVCEALDLVLGPERLFRSPIVDEHDFHCGQYLAADGSPVEIRIEAILVDLSEEATRRFGGHLRRWNDQVGIFIDDGQNGLNQADAPGTVWALPLLFVGRYDRDEDDFVGNTFFDHPTKEVDALDDETEIKLGQGRVPFTRAHKRLCGFVFFADPPDRIPSVEPAAGIVARFGPKARWSWCRRDVAGHTRSAASTRPGNR